MQTIGALAQLARVSDWQSEGHGFDSHTLHNKLSISLVNQIVYKAYFFKITHNYTQKHKLTFLKKSYSKLDSFLFKKKLNNEVVQWINVNFGQEHKKILTITFISI